MEKEKNLRKIQYYLGEKAKYSNYQSTTRALIELLAPYTDTDITVLIAKYINDMIEEHRQKCSSINEFILVCSENSSDELRKYIDDLKYTVELLQEDIERYQQKIEELMKPIPPPPTPEETNRRLRNMVYENDKELFSKLVPLLLRRVNELRYMVCGLSCTNYYLLQNICSILNLDDHEAISRIEDYFEVKKIISPMCWNTRSRILSDHGLVIILALSNIAGYSGEYKRSMNGNFRDDKSMFNKLFDEDSEVDLVSFPSLVYRAFEHPFIQSSLQIENESTREIFKASLRYMNIFSRQLNDINHEVLLTMDCSSVSSDGSMLFAERYFISVPDIWHVLSTPSE